MMISKKMSTSKIEMYFTAKTNGCSFDLGPGKRDVSLTSIEKRQIFPSEELMEREISNNTSESAVLRRAVQHSNNEISTNSSCVTYQRRLSTVGLKRKKLSTCLVDGFVENEAGFCPVESTVVSDIVSGKREDTSSVVQSIATVSYPNSSLHQYWEKLFGIKKTESPKRISGQYFLDLGQADFSSTTCSVCGLMYARGHENDEKVHSAFHKNHLHGIQFKGWQKERVARFIDKKGSRIILVLPDDPPQQQYKAKEVAAMMEYEMGLAPGWLLQNQCKIYLYVSYAKKVVGCIVAEPIERAFRVVMNSSSSETTLPHYSSRYNTGYSSAPPRVDCTNMVTVSPKVALTCSAGKKGAGACTPQEGQKIACCTKDIPKDSGRHSLEQATTSADLAELCSSHKLLRQSLVDSDSKTQSNSSTTYQLSGSKHASDFLVFGNIKFARETEHRKATKKEPEFDVEDLGRSFMCSKIAVPAACGVRGIWVSHSERRKGIATQLLDVLRKTFILGSVLRPFQCAFSQPTPDGKAFAACYCETAEFLVYK